MMKVPKNIGLVLIALVLSCGIWLGSHNTDQILEQRLLQASGTYTTNPNRHKSVTETCDGKDRNNMVGADAQSENDGYKADMAAQFTLDPNEFIVGLYSGETDKSLVLMQNSYTELGIFIGPFTLGLILILVLWPFLCCCCVCPGCCPSTCCQKDSTQQYSKCELIWPGIALLLALVLSMVAAFIGITRAGALGTGIQNVVCSTFIVYDDFLNGNVTADGETFFVGTTTLSAQLVIFNNSIDTIKNTMDELNPTGTFMIDTRSKLLNAAVEVSKIPNNVENGSLTLDYNTPIEDTAPSVASTSTYVAQLGSRGGSGDIADAAQAIQDIDTILAQISSQMSVFTGSVDGFKGQVGTVKALIDDLTKLLTDNLNQVYDGYSTISPGLKFIEIGVTIFFGVVIGFSVLSILGLVLMTFCDKFKCRYLMYIACLILFVIGIIGFLLAAVFSAILPFLYLGCEFIDFSLASPANFRQNFKSIINAKDTSYITTCFVSQSGNILAAIAPDIAQTMDSAAAGLLQLNNFDSSIIRNKLQTNWENLGTGIDSRLDSIFSDLENAADISSIQSVSKASDFTSCADGKFAGDSWIPSTNVLQISVPCQISGGAKVDAACTTPNFDSGSGGCAGCFDTSKVLAANSTAGDALTALNARYPGCTIFNGKLSNIWENYYSVKQSVLTPVKARYTAQTPDMDVIIALLADTIPDTFTRIQLSLETTAKSVTDPTYGLIAGLNCRIVGQDITRVTKVFCLQAFNNLYFLRLVLGIASFGILFAMCCTVCAGVRHYKHSERMGKAVPMFDYDQPSLQELQGGSTNILKDYGRPNQYGNSHQRMR